MDPKKTIAAAGLSGLLTAGGTFAVLDARYAQASDVQQLTRAIKRERVETLEACVRKAEMDLRMVSLTPAAARNNVTKFIKETAESDKERCIRQLERLSDE